MPFFYGTMEQYYSGELVLAELNGVDDGAWAYMALCFFTAAYGVDAMWNVDINLLGFDAKPKHLLALSLITFTSFGIIGK